MIGLLLVLLLMVYIVLKVFQRSEATGHWSHLIDNFVLSPDDFYSRLIEILKDREVPDIHVTRKTFKEGGMLSHQRLYLEVARGDYTFHICAAPWGTGFFFSWWVRQSLSGIDELLILIPFWGEKIVKYRQYHAYYKLDSDTMFRKSVHQSVLQAIDQFTRSEGVRGLSEFERMPTFSNGDQVRLQPK